MRVAFSNNTSSLNRTKIGSLILEYESIFDEQQSLLRQIDSDLTKGKISQSLALLANETLWVEPASAWSTVLQCDQNKTTDSLEIAITFRISIRDTKMKIYEAMPLEFYNITSDNGYNSICWMRYRGPKRVMVNLTTLCISEVYEPRPDQGYVRDQLCQAKTDELRPTQLWEKDTCTSTAPLIKRRIQDKTINSMHRIYCYPWNLTMNGHTSPCPDHAFELEGTTNYTVANVDHVATREDSAVVRIQDLHINKHILTSLNAVDTQIGVKNKTGTGSFLFGLDHLTGKLKETLNKGSEFASNIKISNPFDTFYEFVASVKATLKVIGYIFLAIIIGVVLIIAAPILEVVFFGLSFLKRAYRFWANRSTDLISRLKFSKQPTLPLHARPKYWLQHKSM